MTKTYTYFVFLKEYIVKDSINIIINYKYDII